MRRDIGNNAHGNRNELNFVDSINKGLGGLNLNLKEFIKYICKNENIDFNLVTDISAKYESNTKLKQDCYIFIDDKKFYISLKMGSGNSVHQEKCEDFIEYIKKEFGAPDDICDLWRFFLWADGTLDGTGNMEKGADGNIISRFTATMFKKNFPDKREKLQNFLAKNELKLIEHFLFIGRHSSRVDYIYHGTPLHGSWISKKKILDYQVKHSNINGKNTSCLSVGKMSVQSWNVSMKGNSEHKRGWIQVKYGKMNEDFANLMVNEKENIGTFDGDSQEFSLTQLLNKNKNSKLWAKLIDDEDRSDYFAIKVTKKPLSKLSGKKVFPKSDAYIIKAKIDSESLLKREYILTEDGLKNMKYTVIPNTGISIKLRNSKNYTIQKFTKDSFIKAFSSYIDKDKIEECLLSLLIYSNDKEIYKNENIASDLGVNYDLFIKRMKVHFSEITTEKELLDQIRRDAQSKLINIIKSNKPLMEAIFIGKGWFNDPYYASYIYVHGDLIDNVPTDFFLTTGSGRSKGKYTIEIKPR